VPPRQRLSASDWTAAALDALAAGGLAAVAVEPLATRLGTTKGSFYWHFTNRDALLRAVLERWERTDTEDVITYVEAEAAQFGEMGFPPDEAGRRGQLAYTSYLGLAQLAHATPELADISPAYLDTMIRTLTASP
jgi:AcrR family transcriptional regulator